MYKKRHEMQKSDGPTRRQGPFLARAKTAAAVCVLEMSRDVRRHAGCAAGRGGGRFVPRGRKIYP